MRQIYQAIYYIIFIPCQIMMPYSVCPSVIHATEYIGWRPLFYKGYPSDLHFGVVFVINARSGNEKRWRSTENLMEGRT